MDMMGWSQVSMLKRYRHVIDDMRRDAAQVMGQALWSAPSTPEPDPDPSDTVVELDTLRRRRTW
ncbi:hypothetical protein D3250_07105 [Nesterenkonia natronophila]|uniref:Integrase n=2 Tax=Nesterenkonia natronophila TaxID=2174932 RepID=A0A3A4F220_9MICC|nr:hypothetical protein D3250_07105 [Nesterenkonia natronophila]